MSEELGTWLYAVTGTSDPDVATVGVAGEKPQVVHAAGLSAVVGTVPLAEFGAEALRRNLEDLDWLGRVARAHDAVIATVARTGPVVPIGLATVYRDDDRVRETLAERAQEFQAALDRFRGRTEWGVKVSVEPGEAAPAGGRPAGRGSGAAYLAKRRAALASREDQDRRAAEQATAVRARLAALAVDVRTHAPQSRTLAGEHVRMILNDAYLVDDAHAREFAEAVTACDDGNDAIRVQLTGPWPPYSFTALEER